MTPPYDITPSILNAIAAISEKIGEVNATFLVKQSPELRKQNRIQTIQASLSIEGNTLSTEQITALLDNKRVIGPPKDIKEVVNAIAVYAQLSQYKPTSEASFLAAHKQLMSGLLASAGQYRRQGVGVVKGGQIEHVAPPHANVPFLMKDLFRYLKTSNDLALIKSCVFHYEMEFIHPFLNGNGRMGRLWQTVILMDSYPLFEYLPFETLISNTQTAYYKALADSDKVGKSTPFIDYMLSVIDQSLADLLQHTPRVFTETDRLSYFVERGPYSFTRKDYMQVFRTISTATASRDLKKGVDLGLFTKTGERNNAVYEKTGLLPR